MKWKDVVMVHDKRLGTDRAVEVFIETPDDRSVLNVQELAEKAWRSVNKEIEVGGIKVKVRAFGR